MPAFWQMLQKAEFAANWISCLLEYVELKAATQVTVAASTFLSSTQAVEANSNEPSSAKDRETSYNTQVMQNSKCTTRCRL